MKKDPGLLFRLALVISDALAIAIAFLIAYLFRIHIDSRPYYFEASPNTFIFSISLLIPTWIILNTFLGLYNKRLIFGRSRGSELLRLLISSVIGIMALISFDFFTKEKILPTRMVAIYAVLLCFIFLCVFRTVIRGVRSSLARKNRGTLKAVIIGNSTNTTRLIEHIADFPEDGYSLAGIVANKSFIPPEFQNERYTSLKEALKNTSPDVIFQTDEQGSDYSYSQSVKSHILYYFIPSDSSLSSHTGSIELIGDTPAILVKVTPLIGASRVAKRAMDLLFGIIAFLVALIPMAIIWIFEKLFDIRHSAFYSEYRLSRYNKKVKIYKFRSMKPEYSGMSPEDAFAKMGRPELIEQYRNNGDYLDNDPRITKIGHFLRATSLDELPQLFNVIKGDISLVGPRALVPGELRDYGDRSLLLSVKSGLTGLAQVSGRRELSFEERRSLDLYYVQNWSIWLDFTIMFRTIGAVLLRKGAK